MEEFVSYITASTPRALFLLFSLIFAIYAWYYLARSTAHPALKILGSFIPLIPTIGPFLVLWIFSMPDKQHPDNRASMNHWGRGGRFIGNGSGRFTYTDSPDAAPDRPVKLKAFFWRK